MSRAPALDHAAAFLRMELASGPKAAAALQVKARSAGISADALRRAKRALAVESRRESRLGPWSWAFPAGESSASGHLQEQILDFLLERSEDPGLSAEKRRRFKLVANAIARRRAEEAEAEDLAAFADEPPYELSASERRKRARWSGEAA